MISTETNTRSIKITPEEGQALKDKDNSNVWGDVFARSHSKLVGIATHTVGQQDAEDVVMAGWERFVKKTDAAGPEEIIGEDVLIGAVTSEALSHRRKSRGRYSPKPTNVAIWDREMRSRQPSVEREAIARITLAEVEAKMKKELSMSVQVSAFLHALGYTAPQIAELTNYTPNTVNQGVFRARRFAEENFPDQFS